MNNTNRIAIVGAGVAGMALAILASKQGFHVTVYERASQISSIGAGVTLWPNAMFVLKQLGLAKEIEAIGGKPSYMRQFDRHGVQQSEFDIEAVNVHSGFSSVTILRRDLMSILAKALKALKIAIHFDCSITVQDVDNLKQKFALVVGADGRMNSIVRQTLYPGKVNPRYQGFINIIGISQLKESNLANSIYDFRSPGERFGIVPVNNGLCYWAAAWRADMDRARALPDWYNEMQLRFSSWSEPVQSVLKCYDNTSLNRIFVHDLDPLPYWHQDNVMIIGDAAHAPLPTSGQGACQALEDAWHLSQLLNSSDKLNNALTNFYQQRFTKTSAAQALGRQVAQRIFSDDIEPQPSSGISAKQLSQFWMQGLVC